MASTYSPTLRIELIGDGDQSGIWGQTTNNNLGYLIEQAITGVVTITMVDANYTLTNYNGVTDEARNAVIVATGTNSTQRNIVAPLVEKTYTIKNSTTGGYAVQIIGATGTGVVIPNGATASVYCDGTNFYPLQVNTVGNQTINGNLTVTGTTALQGALSGTTATFAGAISSVSPSFTGTPTAPTAPLGTNTTQIATTAFVTNFATTLGTMSTQNANNVTITGGSINNVSGTNSSMTVGYSNYVNTTGGSQRFNWSGQSGQPTWLWGANDVGNAYLYSPANFSVSYANTSGSASSATQATNATNVNGGNVACSAISVTSGAPTIWMYDTDQADFAMHVNSNLWYVLNQGGSGIIYTDQSGNFTAAGNVTAYSDERLKTGVVTIQNALDTVEKMRGVAYIKDDKPQVGVIAQEVQRVLPQVVQENDDGYLSVAYGNIVGVLIEAIKELSAEVKSLKGE